MSCPDLDNKGRVFVPGDRVCLVKADVVLQCTTTAGWVSTNLPCTGNEKAVFEHASLAQLRALGPS
jgi:hypothetical protein